MHARPINIKSFDHGLKNFLKISCSQTVTFHLFKTGISENKKIGLFGELKKEKLTLIQLKILF